MSGRRIVAVVHGSREVNGYALVGVLWICAAATALAFSASAASRQAVAASRNRIAWSRAEWRAEACLARARSVLVAALAEEAGALAEPRSPVWNGVDEILRGEPSLTATGCVIAAHAVGSRLDVNAAGEATLSRLFRSAGLAPARADSIAAALADWKDGDDIPRPLGAERNWYEAVGRVPPSNRPFTHAAELAMVRGGGGTFAIDSLLGVEAGGISINHAPATVLGQLPGFTPEAVSRVLQARAAGRFVRAFAELSEGLTPSARETMAGAEPELVARASLLPKAWILTARAHAGAPPVTAAIELRIERFGPKILILRRRSWVL